MAPSESDKITLETLTQIVAMRLSDEDYGIPILQIQEILRLTEVTHIPNMPDFIEGVLNLRGKIIPVLDLRKRFHLKITENTDKTRIVIVEAENQTMGLVVDSVSEVINLKREQLDSVPHSITSIETEYLMGVAKIDNRLVVLLDLGKLLNSIEKIALKDIEGIPADI